MTCCFNSKAMPTNNTNYSYHMKIVELIFNCLGYIAHHIMPLVINSPGGGYTHISTLWTVGISACANHLAGICLV